MSWSSQEVCKKLVEQAEMLGFVWKKEYRVKFPKMKRDIAYVDCVWFTQAPVMVPVIGFELCERNRVQHSQEDERRHYESKSSESKAWSTDC